MKQERFTIPGASLQRVDLWIYVTVGYKDIQPGVVVHIKKGSTPANVGVARLPHPGCLTYIIESLSACVAIKRVGLLFKVSSKEAQAPAVIVVAEIYPHVPKFKTFATQCDATQ